jgi:DNA-directed RNA polymerase specialized sigma24 family protein
MDNETYFDAMGRAIYTLIADDDSNASSVHDLAMVAVRAGEALQHLLDLQQQVGQQRAAAVRAMLAEGMSYAEVGATIGLSRQRIEQIVNR